MVKDRRTWARGSVKRRTDRSAQSEVNESVPPTLKKPAEQVAFEVAAARLHALALTIPGDADNLVEEWDMWSEEWNVAMLQSSLAFRRLADDAFGQIVIDAIARREAEARAQAGSPMAEDPVPTEPAHHAPAASESSRATTWSKMEVALPRGKGKKRSRQDLGGDEVAALPPQGMVVHQDPCIKCIGSTVPCHGFPGRTCQNDEEEEVVIVVRTGKGKAVSAWVKGVTVDEGDFEEIMRRLLVCELKVRDTQAQNAELEGEVLGLKAYINRLRQK
ncbi:hypothetical protein PAXRUDRAFT_19052 [Paxillus rubicundulus Ve08.2h10]|uniref:Uncharacterized protein n=1 Tax=Paxillus rubicundulus Ve08.2h10 TaxID=930991 RepID=A0A0D0CJL3_9AGAM|nr:hypothetical protein PAXRUDRAFT_19052 [Paxillus rubicundulus Ve08.2h10]